MAISNISISDQLIIEAQRGNIQARNDLIELVLPQIKKCIRDRSNYHDVLQESVLRVITQLHTFDLSKGFFIRWVSVVTKNTGYRAYNKRSSIKEESFSSFPFDDMESIVERQFLGTKNELKKEIPLEEIIHIIENVLPIQQSKTAKLILLEGLTHNEAAEYLGLTVGTSKSNLKRAKERIIKELNK